MYFIYRAVKYLNSDIKRRENNFEINKSGHTYNWRNISKVNNLCFKILLLKNFIKMIKTVCASERCIHIEALNSIIRPLIADVL